MAEITRLREELPSPPKEEFPSGEPAFLSSEESRPERFLPQSSNSVTNRNGLAFVERAGGALSQEPIIAPELLSRKRIATDPRYPLHERIEAFEDIIDSEVGGTTLSRARNLEREAGLVDLFDRHRREPIPPDRYVIILTGRRS